MTAQPRHHFADVIEVPTFFAACSVCDWSGPDRDRHGDAVADAEEHELAAAPHHVERDDGGS